MKCSAKEIDAVLPQTQCGLCGYGGCLPYAKALVEENASINLCPPGGVETLQTLGRMLDQDPAPYENEIRLKTKKPSAVFIKEDECIGCKKCIQVCPVDAIVGAAKLMHTVIQHACTGCDLCIPACPVDCIETVSLTADVTPEQRNEWRTRHQAREKRLAKQKKFQSTSSINVSRISDDEKKQYIHSALERIRSRKK